MAFKRNGWHCLQACLAVVTTKPNANMVILSPQKMPIGRVTFWLEAVQSLPLQNESALEISASLQALSIKMSHSS